MYKVILRILIVVVILFGVTKFITITNNIKNIEDDIVFTSTSQRTKDSTDNTLISPKKADTHNNIVDTPKYTISKESKDTKSNKLDDSSSYNIINEDNLSDYSVAVSSSIYNAIVSLDKESKEINIKLLDESNLTKANTDRYINLSDSDISYLLSNYSNLVDQFKNYNLLEKYDMVKDMLNKYDTNIKENDLISLALAYLK